MLSLLGFAIFGSALAMALAALIGAVVPRFSRIVDALHRTPAGFPPFDAVVRGERVIAVRRREGAPQVSLPVTLRAVA